MASIYKQFLAAPNSSLLASGAALNYVTTTTSYNGATEIIKHLSTMRNQVKKKKEEFLDVIEGQTSIAVEVESTLEFVTGGGPYLPGLDDNFLSDRTVYLPIMHIVSFDAQGRIAQIRQSWDQGSLLKQLDIIGKTGRNWPIRDSREQLRMITTCLKSSGKVSAPQDPNEVINRSRGNSTNALRDPHASLTLFAPREEIEQAPSASVVSPYAGTRPRQRSFTEILGDEPVEEEVVSPSGGRGRSQSPSKAKAVAPKIGSSKNFQPIRLFEEEEAAGTGAERGRSQSPSKVVAPKIGAGKNYQPIRLFDKDDPSSGPDTPEKAKPGDRFYRPNPKKYQHFDFADGSDPQDTPRPGIPLDQREKSKHDSTWSFDDFTTPQKALPTRTVRHQDVRHWDTEAAAETGEQQAVKPRRDAETHFDFIDDGPSGEPRPMGRPRGAMHNTGLGLYDNNLYSEDGRIPSPGLDPRALGNITNLKDRKKDFDPNFTMTDNPIDPTPPQRVVPEDRMKVVKMMESNWAAYDTSPAAVQKENKPRNGNSTDDGIHIAGDGMGGKKGTKRDWIFGA